MIIKSSPDSRRLPATTGNNSCEMHSESGNSSYSESLTTPIRITNLSRRSSSSNQLSGLLATSRSKDSRLNADSDYNVDADHAIITMKTRVAVRDKTPHRFQVVPLRDVTLLDGGRPSQLTIPPASHTTLLRSASIRRQTYSQVRPVVASSNSHLDTIQNKSDTMMLADSEIPSAGIPQAVLRLSPPFGLDNPARSHALAEQDMNRQDIKATINKCEIFVTTPTKASQNYDASHHAHVQNSPIQSLIMESKSPRKRRTHSENIPWISDNNRRDARNDSDFRMSKRHAIYTQSLYVPFLESPSFFPGSSTEDRKAHHQLFNEDVSDSLVPQEVSFSENIVSESGTTLSNANSDGQIGPTLGRVLPSERPLQALKSPGSAIKNERYRGLNYHRLSRVYPLSAEAKLLIVHPQIVREMFGDIDRAIQEWKQI